MTALAPEIITSFEHLFAERVLRAGGAGIDYTLPAPKWQFLNYMADTKEVVMHGSGDSTISEFQPRQSNDVDEFGDQRAVYAASDGIWATYFAIVDRDRFVRSLVNTCFRVVEPGGTSEPYYYFSVNRGALPHQPWRPGTVYVLPRKTFEPQPWQRSRGIEIESAQWRSFVPVKPLARIAVNPSDFPFLGQIRGHDPVAVRQRSMTDPDGFPWLDD
ncbi:MAG: hypothetical protein WD208_09065 [Dehalococcoidia bacterium]